MLIFYHGDMDGIAAANIYLENITYATETKIKAYEFEYDKEDSILNLKITGKQEDVIFVDCCPNEHILQHLIPMARSLTILDHHISKKELINKYYKEGLINGMSYIGASATLITWCWFHFNQDIEKIIIFLDKFGTSKVAQEKSDVPLAIKLVNSWDIWNGLYIDAEPYKIYFETQNFTPLDEGVKYILNNDVEIRKAIRDGYVMMQFFHNWGRQYCERFGYEVQYKTNSFFVLNVGNANSKIFGDLIKNYDAVIIYCNDGTKYRCSIYSQKDTFNCAEFAEQFSGGGHKGAAGFVLNNLPIWLRDKRSDLILKEEN